MKISTLAAIDVGSNAVRLLINTVEAEADGYAFKKIAYLRVPIRLGEDVFTHARISMAKAGQLTEAVLGFGHIMRAYAVSGFRACATSAMRDAANGAELVRAIRKKAGIDIEIISGAQEAELIYAAGAPQAALAHVDVCLGVDVGGGSTELVVYANEQVQFHDSFQIGTVRLLSQAVDEAEKARFVRCLKRIHEDYAPVSLVASGGNINKASRMLGKKANDPLRFSELETLAANLKALSFDERMRVFGLNDYRADVIVPALDIFIEISQACSSLRDIHVPIIGLADGLIRDLHARRAAGLPGQPAQKKNPKQGRRKKTARSKISGKRRQAPTL